MDIIPRSTLSSYRLVEDKMEFLTRSVHSYVLDSGYLETRFKKIVKAINKIADCFDEVLVETFIGKLAVKLPDLHMGLKLSDYDMKRANIIAAGVITHILIDNDVFLLDTRTKSEMVQGQKKFFTHQYLKLGGSFKADLKKGIEYRPGAVYQHKVDTWKLSSKQKEFLSLVSSVPFTISDVCTHDILLKGYSLKVDWNRSKDSNGRSLSEDPILKRKRISSYADIIINEIKPLSSFYLSAKYCGRDRVYYDAASLEGIRPHGKLWEVLMLDSSVPFDVGSEGEDVLKHLIYVTLHGRVSLEEAVDKFTLEDLLSAESADPMAAEDEDEFGEAILLNKAYQALMDSASGKPSRFLFGYDFTNSGLLMSGVSFRSEEMMKAANIYGSSEVVDSHTLFGAAYDLGTEDNHCYLERNDIKKIHMGLMHGSMLSSISDLISSVSGREVTVDDVSNFNCKAYGSTVHNITNIADWGTQVIGSNYSTLRWTLPDGFKAASRAYFKGVPVVIYCASGKHKEGYVSHVIVSDMPWAEDSRGYPLYGSEVDIGFKSYPVQQKKRGLFANITHSIDAYMLRCITRAVIDAGYPILLKHDDFIVPPCAVPVVLRAAQLVFEELFESNLFQSAIDEIVKYSPYSIPHLNLEVGNADNYIQKSQNFLMP